MADESGELAADMTTVGVIGSGHIGTTVTRLAIAAGHDVVLSNSRGPETLVDLAVELGPRVRPATAEEAAAAGNIVVVAIPVRADAEVPVAPLAGKLVMDTGNYYPARDGQIPELDNGTLLDSQYMQQHLRGAQVVKVFNNIMFKHLQNLARPAGAADRSFLPIAGDSEAAKTVVTEFLDSIGYGTVDAGALADSWRQQPGTPVYVTPYGSVHDEKGTPAGEDVIRAALAAAKR
jgi:8-hydroxy-5-deazaflavin:NADPH oxidoreductase